MSINSNASSNDVRTMIFGALDEQTLKLLTENELKSVQGGDTTGQNLCGAPRMVKVDLCGAPRMIK